MSATTTVNFDKKAVLGKTIMAGGLLQELVTHTVAAFCSAVASTYYFVSKTEKKMVRFLEMFFDNSKSDQDLYKSYPRETFLYYALLKENREKLLQSVKTKTESTIEQVNRLAKAHSITSIVNLKLSVQNFVNLLKNQSTRKAIDEQLLKELFNIPIAAKNDQNILIKDADEYILDILLKLKTIDQFKI